MTIAPAGFPIWSRATSMQYYGGNTQKRDYVGVGAINAKTDVSAAQFARITADLEEAARMATLCRLVVSVNDGAGTSQVLFASVAWAQPMTVPYDGALAPAGYPLIALSSGIMKVGLPASAVDSYGTSADIYPIAGQSGNPVIIWNGSTPAMESWGGNELPTLTFTRPASNQVAVVTIY